MMQDRAISIAIYGNIYLTGSAVGFDIILHDMNAEIYQYF